MKRRTLFKNAMIACVGVILPTSMYAALNPKDHIRYLAIDFGTGPIESVPSLYVDGQVAVIVKIDNAKGIITYAVGR